MKIKRRSGDTCVEEKKQEKKEKIKNKTNKCMDGKNEREKKK